MVAGDEVALGAIVVVVALWWAPMARRHPGTQRNKTLYPSDDHVVYIDSPNNKYNKLINAKTKTETSPPFSLLANPPLMSITLPANDASKHHCAPSHSSTPNLRLLQSPKLHPVMLRRS